MINRIVAGCMAFCMLSITNGKAQTSPLSGTASNFKQVSLRQFPATFDCNTAEIDRLFVLSGHVTSRISPAFTLNGEIIAKVSQDKEVQSLNIRLSDLVGATATFSRIKMDNGTIRYTGYILQLHDTEALILKNENGRYFFIRESQKTVLAD